jgi:hypothetical protein
MDIKNIVAAEAKFKFYAVLAIIGLALTIFLIIYIRKIIEEAGKKTEAEIAKEAAEGAPTADNPDGGAAYWGKRLYDAIHGSWWNEDEEEIYNVIKGTTAKFFNEKVEPWYLATYKRSAITDINDYDQPYINLMYLHKTPA